MAEQKAPLDFASGQASDSDELTGAIPQSVNVLVDKNGGIHLRPGIATWTDFDPSPLHDPDTSVDGISVWNGYPVYVTSDRLLHVQLSPGDGVDLSDATAATQLDGTTRPILCPTRTRIVVAGGGQLQKWEGPAFPLSARLTGAPAATHVVAISQRLVVNPTAAPGQIQWSDPGETAHETWTGEFDELESRPDILSAIYDNTGEIIGLGKETVETVAPDPEQIFTTVRTWMNGTIAPYSFVSHDEMFGFLDSLKRVQLGNGRAYKEISGNISADIEALSSVSDCWGARFKIDGWNLLGWNFPASGRMFVYDVDGQRWSEWRGYSAGQWTGWAGKSHYYWPDQGKHLVGLGDGTIGLLRPGVITDNGEPIVAEIYTGFTDHDTDNWKQHISTRFMFRRGLGAFGRSPGPKCQLFWRDSTGGWEDPIELDLGNVDDPAPVIEARSLGMYRTRQWKLRMSDDVPLVFVGAMETFEVLEQ